MRIAINAVAVDGGGGETYLRNILEALSATAQDEFILFLAPRHRTLLDAFPPQVQVVICRSVPRRPALRMLWEQAVLPLILQRWKVDLLYAAFNTAVLASPVPVVLLSHNATAYSRLSIAWSRYGQARKTILRVLEWLSARVARRVVFVSHTSARAMAPQMGLAPFRVRVVHHGWRSLEGSVEPGRAAALDLPPRYLLCVSDLYPYKNLECLLEAFDKLMMNGYPGDLVVVGGEQAVSSEYGRKLARLRERSAFPGRIRFLGSVPHAALAAVYGNAELFVFPSLLETFGLPLLEAMGAGTPVVVADWRLAPGGENGHCNVGPEICGDAAVFFNPLSPDSLQQAVARLLCDTGLRERSIERGRVRAAEFSWERAASQLRAIFREALAQ